MSRCDPSTSTFTYLAGGEFDEHVIDLTITGEHLDPAEVTLILGVEPTRAHRKGDLSSNGKRTHRVGLWQLGTRWTTEPLQVHLDRFLASLPGDAARWETLSSGYDCSVRLLLRARTSNRMADLSAHAMRELSRRHLAVKLDVVFDDDDALWTDTQDSRPPQR